MNYIDNNAFLLTLDEIVAQFKYTVLLMPSGINLVTGLPFDLASFESEHNILDAELKDLVLSEIPNKKSKHTAKKKGDSTPKAAASAAPPAAEKEDKTAAQN